MNLFLGIFMICPKCGEKYEDDMPRCLWCDAPNPNEAEQTKSSEMALPNAKSETVSHAEEIKFEEKLEFEREQNSLNFDVKNDCIIYKLSKSSHFFNVLGMMFLASYVLFSIVDWLDNLDILFVDKMRPLWPIIVCANLLFSFATYIFSKKNFGYKMV